MEIKLEKPVIRGRFLFHKTGANPGNIPNPIVVPFGSISSVKSYDFYVTMIDNEIVKLTGRSPMGTIDILPIFKETISINTKIGNIKFVLSEVIKDREKRKAFNIISRSHYLNSPIRGLFLGCKFEHEQDQEKIRRQAAQENLIDEWSESWNEKPGSIIGCVVLDRLVYGNPRGRLNIAQNMGHEGEYQQWVEQGRAVVLANLNVAWISRVAIDAPYRNLGLGGQLVNHLGFIANKKIVPNAEYLEMFTTLPKDKALEILANPSKSFLHKVGFDILNEALPSIKLFGADNDGERITPIVAKKLYFYRKAWQ